MTPDYKHPIERYLVLDGPLMTAEWLVKRLIVEGLKKQRCENCELDTWQGEPMPLQRHHVDGNPSNNVLANIQLLCPNCHALTPNFCGRGRLREKVLDEPKPKRPRKVSKSRSTWPTKEHLQELLDTMPQTEAAKVLGVKWATLGYWIKSLGVKSKKRGHWHREIFKKATAVAEVVKPKPKVDPWAGHPYPALASHEGSFFQKAA